VAEENIFLTAVFLTFSPLLPQQAELHITHDGGKTKHTQRSSLSFFSDSQMETQAVLEQITLVNTFWDWFAEEDTALITAKINLLWVQKRPPSAPLKHLSLAVTSR